MFEVELAVAEHIIGKSHGKVDVSHVIKRVLLCIPGQARVTDLSIRIVTQFTNLES